MRRILLLTLAVGVAIPAGHGQAAAGDPAALARSILKETGVRGGLVVQIGVRRGGQLTAALRASDAFLVQGFDTDPTHVEQVRAALSAKGLRGSAMVDGFDGKTIPLTDNVARLVVAAELGNVPMREVMRVLCPGGVAMIAGKKHVKPRPEAIDNWTHYLHDATNNAVAADTVVGPPRHVQWLAGPKWTRTHHQLNSVSSVVTAGGRLFTIVDESTAADMTVPPKWMLVARDAFSGVRLWSRPLESWANTGVRFRSGPAQVTRLLVTDGERVYAPLGLNKPITAIDAATGETIATYQATEAAEEIVLTGKVLLAMTGDPVAEHAAGVAKARGVKMPNKKSVVAIDVETGQTAWTWTDPEAAPMPETLAADGERAYLQSGGSAVCLDLATGDVRWRCGEPKGEKPRGARSGFGRHVLVVSDGVVLCNLAGELTAIDAMTGKKLWKATGGNGFHAPMDVFVIDGVVWTGIHPQDSVSPPPVNDFSEGRDLRTGKVLSTNTDMVDLQTAGHHHRCYREKATTRFILGGKRGIELMDLTGENHSRNNWVRGTCQYGILPANGMLYIPPHSCGCYMESKLSGFWALAAKATERPAQADADRLTKGPAYGHKPANAAAAGEWPQYRGDVLRSGTAGEAVPANLTTAWKARIGGRLSQPVVAGGKLLVASVDAGTVHAIDEKTGELAWIFPAGGRVDSPPAIHGDVALFGSADGRVYCVRLADGQLIWKFLAARADVRTVANGRVESLWPVHGSVLVFEDTVYFAAGRSTWLDGGIDLYGLDPATGAIRHRRRLASRHPVIGEGKDKAADKYNDRVAQNLTDYRTYLQPDRSDAFSMAGGAVTDVLVSDGTNVFMHHAKFDAKLAPQAGLTRHLFSTSNLLDDTENHRSHWVLGTGDFSKVAVAYSWIANSSGARWGGMAVPAGLMMAFDDQTLWMVRRSGNKGPKYSLQARPNAPFDPDEKPLPDFGRKVPEAARKPKWSVKVPFRPRAMLKAGGHIVLAGHPTDAAGVDRRDLYFGRGPGMLHVIAAADGATLSRHELDAPPVWDGVATAGGRLYVSTADGQVVCLRGAKIK